MEMEHTESRRKWLMVLAAAVAGSAMPAPAEDTAPPATGPAVPPAAADAGPPDDEVTRACNLIAQYIDREKADDIVYAVLIMILRTQCKDFPVPEWLEKDQCWKDQERAEQAYAKLRAGIATL